MSKMPQRIPPHTRRGVQVQGYTRRRSTEAGLPTFLVKGPASWIDPEKLRESDPIYDRDQWNAKYGRERAPWPGEPGTEGHLPINTARVLERDYKRAARPGEPKTAMDKIVDWVHSQGEAAPEPVAASAVDDLRRKLESVELSTVTVKEHTRRGKTGKSEHVDTYSYERHDKSGIGSSLKGLFHKAGSSAHAGNWSHSQDYISDKWSHPTMEGHIQRSRSGGSYDVIVPHDASAKFAQKGEGKKVSSHRTLEEAQARLAHENKKKAWQRR